MNPTDGIGTITGEWILNKRLRRGLREALDAGCGKLRMDPQDLANHLGKAIDLEVERLGRVRRRIEKKRRVIEMLRPPECYFFASGCGGARNNSDFNRFPKNEPETVG